MEAISLQQPVLLWISFFAGANSLLQLQNLPKGKGEKRGVAWFMLPPQQA